MPDVIVSRVAVEVLQSQPSNVIVSRMAVEVLQSSTIAGPGGVVESWDMIPI